MRGLHWDRRPGGVAGEPIRDAGAAGGGHPSIGVRAVLVRPAAGARLPPRVFGLLADRGARGQALVVGARRTARNELLRVSPSCRTAAPRVELHRCALGQCDVSHVEALAGAILLHPCEHDGTLALSPRGEWFKYVHTICRRGYRHAVIKGRPRAENKTRAINFCRWSRRTTLAIKSWPPEKARAT